MDRRIFLKTIAVMPIQAMGQYYPAIGGSTPATPCGIGEVQKASYGSAGNASPHSVTFNTTPVEGNLLIVLMVASATSSGTPSGWILANSAVDLTGTYVYYKIAGAAESTTFSVSLTTPRSCALMAYEFEGMAAASPLDKTAKLTAQDNPVGTGTTAATSQANELLIAVVGLSDTAFNVLGWSNGFANDGVIKCTVEADACALGAALRTATAIGTYGTAATLNSAPAAGQVGIICTFKGAP